MTTDTLTTVIGTLTATLFFVIGAMLLKRKTKSAYTRPMLFFALWWLIIGFNKAQIILQKILVDYEYYGLHLFLFYLNTVLVFAGIFFLLYYTLVIFTGNEKTTIPFGIFFLALMILTLVFEIAANPQVITDASSGLALGTIDYVLPNYMITILVLGIIVPQLGVCIALYVLFAKLKGQATQRYRVFLISTAIFLWFGSSLVVWLAGGAENSAIIPVIQELMAILAGVMIYFAYNPPMSIKKKYGILGLADENAVETGKAVQPEE